MILESRIEEGVTELAAAFASLPQVAAVAMGGSLATGLADPASDIDLYVYATAEVPVAFRAQMIKGRATRHEIDNRFFETGDEWEDSAAGVRVDVIYRSPGWAEGELDGVLDRHEARIGYSTCIWHNILTARSLLDRTGWFAALQERARQPYPDALVRSIVAKNRPLLRDTISSFREQIIKAARRGDGVSVNHRIAAFLASYFDVVFALNRALHPGEKRLLAVVCTLAIQPASLACMVDRLLAAAAPDRTAELPAILDALCDGLDACLMLPN